MPGSLSRFVPDPGPRPEPASHPDPYTVGLITVAFNLLGSTPRPAPGESTGLRVDEAVKGALFSRPESVTRERQPRVNASTTHILDGAPPRELGR